MKKTLKNKIINELYTIPIVTIACEKHGVSRQTFYRWKSEDEEFKKKVEEIMSIGIESINDLAESTLIKHIKSGDVSCTKFWLSNNKYNYIRPRDKEFFQKTNIIVPDKPRDDKLDKIVIEFVDYSDRSSIQDEVKDADVV